VADEADGSKTLLRWLQILAVTLSLLGLSSIPAAFKYLDRQRQQGGKHKITSADCQPMTTALNASSLSGLTLQTQTTLITQNAVCAWTGQYSTPRADGIRDGLQLAVYNGPVNPSGAVATSIIGLPSGTFQIGTTNQSPQCYILWPLPSGGSAMVFIIGLVNVYGTPACGEAATAAQEANDALSKLS
jgi:hypothetical protein